MTDIYSQATDDFFRLQPRARTNAVLGSRENADNAARALELSRSTGVPAPVIAGDLESFDANNRSEMAAEIVGNNPALSQYVDSDPLASVVSNDDYGTLDTISQTMGQIRDAGKPWAFSRGFVTGLTKQNPELYGEALEAASRLVPESMRGAFAGAGDKVRGIATQVTGYELEAKRLRDVTNTTEALATLGEMFGGGMASFAPVIAMAAAGAALGGPKGAVAGGLAAGAPLSLGEVYKALKDENVPPDIAAQYAAAVLPIMVGLDFASIAVGPVGALLGFGKATAKDAVRDAVVARVAKGIAVGIAAEGTTEVAQELVKAGTVTVASGKPFFSVDNMWDAIEAGIGGAMVGGATQGAAGAISPRQRARQIEQQIEPYLRNGEPVPIGIDPEIDKLIVEQSKQDLQQLDRALSEVQGSTTRERSPEMFANFLRGQVDGEIGIPIDALVKVYGDKPFGPEDGILGWVPGLWEQIRVAVDSGGDIRVPMADWLARVDPAVAKELHDNIRVRRGGVTVEEAKVFADIESEQVVEPTQDAVQPETIQVQEPLDRTSEVAQAVRAQAGFDIIPEVPDGWDRVEPGPKPDYKEGLEGGEERYYGSSTRAYVKPAELFTKYEKVINAEVDKILERVAPGAERQVAAGLEVRDNQVAGVYIDYQDRKPLIMWSFRSKDPIKTARHEAIHYLRHSGFFTKDEWETLKSAAIEGGWIGRHRIKERYHGAGAALMLEESIAEQFAKVWAANPANVSKAVNSIFEKLRMVMVLIQEAVEAIIGRKLSADDLFSMVESGEIGSRQGATPLNSKSFREGQAAEALTQQGELDVTRQESKKIFEKGMAIGLTEATIRKLLAKIDERDKGDQEAQRERAIEFEKRRQSREWKEESETMQVEVRKDLDNRPDIAATDFFRYGTYGGEKVTPFPKLAWEALSAEQRKALPPQWISKNGMLPDDAAPLFGYQTGREMLDRMLAYETARGKLQPGVFYDRLVRSETEQRMVAKYGELGQNILSSAEDHVLGLTQMDLLHEQTLAMAELAKKPITFTKADVLAMVEKQFENLLADGIKTQDFLNDAGRAGRSAFAAAIKEDFAEAFRQAQRQQYAGLLAKEAKTFEKETGRFERLIKPLSGRKVPPSMDQEFFDFIQQLLLQGGVPMNRSMAEIQENIDKGNFTTLESFVESHNAEGWEIAVPDWILQGQLKDRAGKLTVQEAREFRDAVKSLAHVGRGVQKQVVSGDAQDSANLINKIVDGIKQLPKRNPKTQGRWWVDAGLTRMEEILKDLDQRKEAGPLFENVIRPMAEAKHTEYSYQEALEKRLKEIKGQFGRAWQKSLNDSINQDFLIDPHTEVAFDLTRGALINLMMNFGNQSNIDAFTRGYFPEDQKSGEARLRDLINTHATKEDWDFVKMTWDVFKMWDKPRDQMYYELSGIAPKKVPPIQVDTPFGSFEGGYYPLFRDKLRSPPRTKASGDIMGPGYHKSTPTNNYTIERTKATYFVEFQNPIDQLAARWQQEMHDIAYRRALMGAAKILRNPKVVNAATLHYGQEYVNQFEPWIKKIANQFNLDDQSNQGLYDWLRRARTNVVGHSLPFSLRVILTPDVGQLNPVAFSQFLGNRTEWTKIAMDSSKEIPHTFRNMDRDFRERLERLVQTKGLDGFQADAARLGFKPVVWLSQQFRITTFVDEYHKALERGLDEGKAAAHADSLVRLRHGSGGVPDLPAALTGPEPMKALTVFYQYFNTMYNVARRVPGAAREGNFSEAMLATYTSVILGSIFTGLIFQRSKEDESWGAKIAKVLALQLTGMVPFVRDIGSWAIEGYQPRTPIESIIGAGINATRMATNYTKNKRIERPIQTAANVVGLTTGLPLAQAGRTAQFHHDLYTGKQRLSRESPKNILEWINGTIHGEIKPRR